MRQGPVYIVSDLHLGAVPSETERAFCRWLDYVRVHASRLVINGDLFDFWFEYTTVIPRGHTRVLGALAAVVDAGVPIDFMGGNHDWWAGGFLENEIGMTVHHEPTTLDLAGKRVFLAHGDGLGPGDLGYRILKLALRGRLTRWAFRWLHPDVGARLAAFVSRTEGRAGPDLEERELARARFLREWSLEKLSSDPSLDLVLLGHAHLPEFLQNDRGAYYVNGGDWVRHRSYVLMREGQAPSLETWDGSRGG